MGKFSQAISLEHMGFIAKQKMFFVGSAPLAANGHINVSPKGTDSFRVLTPNRVAYLDLVGSGNETSAHLLENERITLMFCAYEGAPNIMRLYGKGRTLLPQDAAWQELATKFDVVLGTRQIIIADIHLVQTSCGFSVPLYKYIGERDFAQKWAVKKGEDGLNQYIMDKNLKSLDGLPTAYSKQLPQITKG